MARRHGVTSATISSGGSSATLCASSASKASSRADSRSCSRIAVTSQHRAQPFFQAVQPTLDRALGHAELGGDLCGGL